MSSSQKQAVRIEQSLDRRELPESWREEMGDVDLDVVLIMMTLARLSRQVQDHYQSDLRTLRTTYSEYAALHALLISGPPYAMTPSLLNETLGLSSGGITKTIDRLESEALISRSPDPQDGRGVLVTLTDKGRQKTHRIFGAGLVHYSKVLGTLSPDERRDVADALKLLFDAFDAQQDRPVAR